MGASTIRTLGIPALLLLTLGLPFASDSGSVGLGGSGRLSVLLIGDSHGKPHGVTVRLGRLEVLHGEAGWRTIAESAGTFALDDLGRRSPAELGSARLPSGEYLAVRFVVERAFLEAGRRRIPLSIPISRRLVHLRKRFCLPLGEGAKVVLEWDIDESLRDRVHGRHHDRPFHRDGGKDRHERLAFRPAVGIKSAPRCDINDDLEDAIALARAGNHAGAVDAFTAILARDPGSAAAYAYRGFSLIALGQAAEGASDFQAAKRIVVEDLDGVTARNPGDLDAQYQRSLLLSDLGEHAQAVAHLAALVLADPVRSETHFQLGNARFRSGNIAGSILDYDNAIALDAGDYRAYLARASAKRELGDQAGADADVQTARQLVPEDRVH